MPCFAAWRIEEWSAFVCGGKEEGGVGERRTAYAKRPGGSQKPATEEKRVMDLSSFGALLWLR